MRAATNIFYVIICDLKSLFSISWATNGLLDVTFHDLLYVTLDALPFPFDYENCASVGFISARTDCVATLCCVWSIGLYAAATRSWRRHGGKTWCAYCIGQSFKLSFYIVDGFDFAAFSSPLSLFLSLYLSLCLSSSFSVYIFVCLSFYPYLSFCLSIVVSSVLLWVCLIFIAILCMLFFWDDCMTPQVGYTTLISAAERGRVDCVRLLLNAGANKNATDHVRFCLHFLVLLCVDVASSIESFSICQCERCFDSASLTPCLGLPARTHGADVGGADFRWLFSWNALHACTDQCRRQHWSSG